MKKLITLLFSVFLIFTTQSVSAQDQAAGSSNGLQAIPVDFIALPVIIILLVALGFFIKHYSRFRYNPAEDTSVEPIASPKPDTSAAAVVAEHTEDTNNQVHTERQLKISQEETAVTPLKKDNVKTAQVPAIVDEDPVPKDYKLLHIFAYILIVAGLIMRLVTRRKK